MHIISSFEVSNFRSIKSAKFDLTQYTPLVGYNNAGKTNIMTALQWGIRRRSLAFADFNNPDLPVSVMVQISGVSAEVLDAIDATHRKKIQPLVSDGSVWLRRSQEAPDAAAKDIRLEVLDLSSGSEEWRLNPSGIDAAISALFPEPIIIGAMENATEDVGKFGASTTIGKLLKEIITPVGARHSEAISAALADISKKLSADGPEKDEDLKGLDHRIQNEMSKFFPGVLAKIHIPTPDFGDFLRNATIRVFDGTEINPDGREASQFGHGAQRSVQMALVKCLSEIKREQANVAGRTTLLLIDEPELFLHPQAVEVIRSSLSKLSSDGYQVIFSTHSGNMITRHDAPNVLLIRRTENDGTFTTARLSQAVRDAVAEADHQSEILFSLSNSNKIFFSEKVLLAEGKTEQALLPSIYEHVMGFSLSEAKIALVDLGGVGNILKSMAVLNSMGINTKAAVDLDFAFKGAISSGLIKSDDPSILVCKKIFQNLAEKDLASLDEASLPRRNGDEPAIKAYGRLAADPEGQVHVTKLHDALKQHGVWVWEHGAIEDHLDLESKRPAAHAQFLQNMRDEGFLESLPRFAAARALLDWLD